jgi:hypothetical protein
MASTRRLFSALKAGFDKSSIFFITYDLDLSQNIQGTTMTASR